MAMTLDRRELLGAASLGAVALALLPRKAFAGGKFPVAKSDSEWRQLLGRERFAVLRQAATERPYSSPLNDEHRKGTFVCAGCANPLFSSAAKFDSGTGWPSFFRPLAHGVVTRPDNSLGMERTEVLCARCGGHLGHLFDDGPRPTGLRYCMNGLAMRFIPA